MGGMFFFLVINLLFALGPARAARTHAHNWAHVVHVRTPQEWDQAVHMSKVSEFVTFDEADPGSLHRLALVRRQTPQRFVVAVHASLGKDFDFDLDSFRRNLGATQEEDEEGGGGEEYELKLPECTLLKHAPRANGAHGLGEHVVLVVGTSEERKALADWARACTPGLPHILLPLRENRRPHHTHQLLKALGVAEGGWKQREHRVFKFNREKLQCEAKSLNATEAYEKCVKNFLK